MPLKPGFTVISGLGRGGSDQHEGSLSWEGLPTQILDLRLRVYRNECSENILILTEPRPQHVP